MIKELPFPCTNASDGLSHHEIEPLPTPEEIVRLFSETAVDTQEKIVSQPLSDTLEETVKRVKAVAANKYPQTLPSPQEVSQIVQMDANLVSDTRPESTSDTSFIKERHGYESALTQTELNELKAQKNLAYEQGSPELVRKDNEIRCVEFVKRIDFVNLPTLTGHATFDDYLADKYKAINATLAPSGVTAVVSRVIVIEDDVVAPASWHAGWVIDGFHDSNGADGVWYDGEFYNPASDSRWKKDGKYSIDVVHEWLHRAAHVPHTYTEDTDLSESSHPALGGISDPWKKYYNWARWGEDVMNGGDVPRISEPLLEMLRRRVASGTLHNDALVIPQGIGSFINGGPREVTLALGSTYAGAQVEIYRTESKPDGSRDLEPTPRVSGTTVTNEDGNNGSQSWIDNPFAGDIRITNPFVDFGEALIPGENAVTLLRVTKPDGTIGWTHLSWGDFYLAEDTDARINIGLATSASAPPSPATYDISYGLLPPAPDTYTLFLPLVTR